ncbi:MAG: hypothetical protein ACJ8AI_32890 [Rhodopila sp.]
MTSSTSTSRLAAADGAAADRAWRRWIVAFCASSAGVAGTIFLLLLLIDPYDSHRFPNLGLVGIADTNTRMAHVSRGRNPRFDSAIFGNSTSQMIDPHRLSEETGLSFTSLPLPAAGPREELALMRWVLRNHSRVGAWVIVTDPVWCSPDPHIWLEYPFPFWLYGTDLDYLANVFNGKSFDRAAYRIQIALGLLKPSDQVGYSDYALNSKSPGHFDPPPQFYIDPAPKAPFPWVDALGAMIRSLPADAAVVLLMPPVYHSMIPPPGSSMGERLDRCKAALAQMVAGRKHSGFLDFRIDTADTRDALNFNDGIHFRHKLAREQEAAIIGVLRQAPLARR